MNAQILSFFDATTCTASHLIFDHVGGHAAIIDPVLDYEPKSGRTMTTSADKLLAALREHQLTLVWILETHAHADHLSSAHYLQERAGGKIAIGGHIKQVQTVFKSLFHLEETFPINGSQFDHLFEENETFFIGGLVAFLIGHLLYASAFYLDYKLNKTVYQKYTENAVMAYGFYVVIFCVGMWTYLGDMKIPVIIYALVISLMGVMAVNRYGRVNTLSFKLTFYGSVLFVISDSVLALNRFVHEFHFSGVIVMATYMAAQYMITLGNIERKMKKKVEEI